MTIDARRRIQGSWLLATILVISVWCAASQAAEVYVRDTGSMRGWIVSGGAWYNVQAVPLSAVKVGDVVLYRHSKAGLVAHRVIEVGGGKVWTKGDSNRIPDDEYVTAQNFKGVLIRKP